MAENSKIEWCDHTFNGWEGCTPLGPGCDNCYASSRHNRFNRVPYSAQLPRRRTSEANWKQPLKWNRKAEKEGIRYRVFCSSLGDVFDNAVPAQWRADLLQLIADTPHLDWLLLTKRIGNALAMLNEACPATPWSELENGLPNVWLGITICNQAEADRDIPILLNMPAAKRFVSIEPMLGRVDLERIILKKSDAPEKGKPDVSMNALKGWYGGTQDWPFSDAPAIDWVIVGGESGPNARPIHPDWARSVRDQCAAAGVPFMFKQWGEWWPNDQGQWLSEAEKYVHPDAPDCNYHLIGKKRAGHLLDGKEHMEFPGEE